MEKDKERYDVLRERWRRRKLSEEKKVSKAGLDKLGEMEDEDFDVSDPKRVPTYERRRYAGTDFTLGKYGYICVLPADASLSFLIEKNLQVIQANQGKIDRLANAFVDGPMSEEAYQAKLRALTAEKGRLQKEKEDLEYKERAETEMGKRLQAFRDAAIESNGEELKEFNEDLYNACIDKVIVGGYDEKKEPDP